MKNPRRYSIKSLFQSKTIYIQYSKSLDHNVNRFHYELNFTPSKNRLHNSTPKFLGLDPPAKRRTTRENVTICNETMKISRQSSRVTKDLQGSTIAL